MQFSIRPRVLVVLAAFSCFGIGQVCAQKTRVSAPVSSQSDLFEASLGFNYIYLDRASPESKNLYGLGTSLFVNATSWLGVGGDFIVNFGSHRAAVFSNNSDVDSQRYVYVF